MGAVLWLLGAVLGAIAGLAIWAIPLALFSNAPAWAQAWFGPPGMPAGQLTLLDVLGLPIVILFGGAMGGRALRESWMRR